MNNEYPISVGDTVCHIKDHNLIGIVKHIDTNLAHPTTCNVLWNNYIEMDIQWTNKLIKLEDGDRGSICQN